MSAIALSVFPQDSTRDMNKRAVASRSLGSRGGINGQGKYPVPLRRPVPLEAVLRRFFAITHLSAALATDFIPPIFQDLTRGIERFAPKLSSGPR